MDQVVPPSTPTRRSASTSNLARRQGEIASANSVTQASQSTPLSSSESHIPAPLVGDTSSSGEGSIVLHSVSDRTSASGLESSFEAIHLGTVAQHSTDSSLEIIVHSSPATTGFLAFSESQPSQNPESSTASPSKPAEQVSGVTNESRHSRQTSLVAIDEKKPLAILSPVAHTFAPAQSTSSAKLDTFEKIVAFGKDELGHLTPRAKEALARLGLKPVPSLHGPLNLPYARCASGIDAFVPNDDPGGEPWGEDEPDESRHQRTQPIPLPGNSRYTLAGRLAMRYSSAPAALENGNKRSNQTSSTSRTAQASIPKFKKPSHANRPLAAPQPRKQQQRSTGATGARSASSSSAQAQEAPRDRALHQVPNQFDLDVQAFARAQAMQNLFLQHAQMAQALGGGQQLSPSYQSNQTGSSNSSGGWPRAQSPYLPPFQPFTPPLLNTPHPSGSRPSQLQPSDQVDSLTLLKLAGQRQLGLNPTGFPIAPPQINLEPNHPISYESDDGDDSDSGRETEPLGGRQAEDANSIDSAKDYDRSAVAYAPVGSGTPAYTGYDFLRRASAQETRASGAGEQGNIAINRRNSAFTHGGVALPQQSRGPTAPNPAQETRRRRSAAPAVPYPGHSHRKASTSSIVTVNSTVPGPVPQVRIFSDSSAPPVPPASSAHRRRSMVATGRPLEDVVNAQPLSVDRDQKHARATTSPAEASTNWRRTSLPTAGEPTADAQEQVSPPPSFNAPPASRVEAQTSRGRGRGARGRKRGGRGGSRTRGGQYANASQNG